MSGSGYHSSQLPAAPLKRLQGLTEALPLEVLPHVLEQLGSSLAAAIPSCKGVAQAAESGDAVAFRPLTFCMDNVGSPSSRLGRVARDRQPQSSWRDIAHVVHCPGLNQASWHEQLSKGKDWPSHRHSVATCGAPGVDEAALLFGGNIGRSVAGNWRTSADLYLADLDTQGEVSMKQLSKPADASWPVARWGASLTAGRSAIVLWGGWSRDGEADRPWKLNLREAAPEWSEMHVSSATSPPQVAFHTTSALPDGRMAVVGGLGDGGSHSGVWMFDPLSERWDQAAENGPACAGHVAGVDTGSQRLVIFGGVQRERTNRFPRDDAFLNSVSVFDIRQQRWDTTAFSTRNPGPEPCSRRNAAYGTLGSHLIITGGFSDEKGQALNDTWILNMRSGQWHDHSVIGAPELEGHKAVVSGLDFFTFGGHSAPGTYPRKSISVHRLALGSHDGVGTELIPAADASESGSGEEESEDEDGEGQTVMVRMQDNEGNTRNVRMSVHMLNALLRMQLESE